jgi:hypothetical protein
LQDPESGWSQSLQIQVPFTLMPHAVTYMEQEDSKLLEIRGGYPGEVFQMEVLDGKSLALIAKSSLFQSLVSSSATLDDNLNYPAHIQGRSTDITSPQSFFLVVRSRNRPQLPALTSSRIHILPGRLYEGKILAPEGTAIEAAVIRSIHARDQLDQPYSRFSNDEGEFSMTLPLRSFGDYHFLVDKDGFIPLEIEGKQLLAQPLPPSRNEITLQIPTGSLSGKVLGLEKGDQALLLAHLQSENQGKNVLGRTQIMGSGSGIDSFNIPVNASQIYAGITLRAKGYISTLIDNKELGFDLSLFEFSDLSIPTRKIDPIEIKELSNTEEGVELRISVSGSHILSFTVEALDLDNYPVSFLDSFSEPEGIRLLLPALPQINILLRDASGIILKTYSVIPEKTNADLPSGQVPVDLKAGFDQSFESRENAAQRVEVQHPGQSTSTDQKVSFLEVYTREIQSNIEGPAVKNRPRIYEIAVKSVTSEGTLLEISEQRDGLENMVLTLPFDPREIPPGELESGRVFISHAPDLESLAAGEAESIPPEDIMGVDYLNGRVSFKVNHLSVFTLGLAPVILEPEPQNPASQPQVQLPLVPSESLYGAGSGGCFIATASYGRKNHPFVQILIRFRDEILSSFRWGQAFIRAYYQYSPPIASWIGKRPLARACISLALLPLVAFSWLVLHKVWMLALSLIVLVLACLKIPDLKSSESCL